MAELHTLKSVIAYGRQLTLRAEVTMSRDPFADPYRPTEAAAKRLFHTCYAEIRKADQERADAARLAGEEITERTPDEQRSEAAQRAINTLAARARESERERHEYEKRSRQSLERHQRRQREAARDREQRRNRMTIGQRLDQALADFSVICAADAARIGWSTPSTETGIPMHTGDPAGEAKHKAITVVREIEALLDRHQLRDVSKDKYASRKKAA